MSMNDSDGYGAGGGGEAPPVVAGELGGLEEPAKWPTVLGWFSIVLGGLGILKNGCGAFSNLVTGGAGMTSLFSGGGKSPQAAQIEQAMAGLGPWIMLIGGLNVISMFISVLLLVAGIQLVSRKRSSVGLHKAWSWVRIAMVVLETGAGLVVQSAMVSAVMSSLPQGSGGPPPAAVSTMIMVFTVAGTCFGVLLALAYPVVVLVVLSKRWAKEEVARWEGGGGVKAEW